LRLGLVFKALYQVISESAKPERPCSIRGLSGGGSLIFIVGTLILLFINLKIGICQEIIVIHPNVGATIDLEEKIHYDLFPEFYNFSDAQFYQTHSDTVIAKIRLWTENGYQEQLQYFTPYQMYIIASRIATREPLSDESRKLIQKKYRPLYADKFLAEIPVNSYCRLKLKDKSQFDAVYYRLKGDSLLFWMDRRIVPINRNNIVKLRCWEHYRQNNWVKWGSMGSVAIVTYFGAGLVADWLNVSTPTATLTQFAAASIGCIIGYKISPIINEYIMPSTVIQFHTGRIKRLDTIARMWYNVKKTKDKIWQTITP